MNNDTKHAKMQVARTSEENRAPNDFYATPPFAVEMLCDIETFSNNIWEPACGMGHISKVLEQRGYNVKSTDLIYRGYGVGDVDFLLNEEKFDGDIVTNPPYKQSLQFVEKAIDTVTQGHKVAMFMPIRFLEGKARRKLFDRYPPYRLWVSTSRICCIKNGDLTNHKEQSLQAYGWFIWKKGFTGPPVIKWFN